jgi:hypothetical protein
MASRIVAVFLAHHRKWRGFRASLRALVSTDQEIRGLYQELRRRQLEILARRRSGKAADTARERDALLTFTLERASDALADGEAAALGLRPDAVRELLVEIVRSRFP